MSNYRELVKNYAKEIARIKRLQARARSIELIEVNADNVDELDRARADAGTEVYLAAVSLMHEIGSGTQEARRFFEAAGLDISGLI